MRTRVSLAVIVILMLSILFSGCNGGLETDQIVWVVTIGIDKADDGELEITYRIAIPQSLAGDASGGGKKESSQVITVKAPNLAEGRNLLNTVTSRTVSLSQVRAIVISETLAGAGVGDLISPLIRFREFRGTIFLLVCRGHVRTAFLENNPELDILTSKWIENVVYSVRETSFYPTTNLHQFYRQLKAKSGSPFVMWYAINPLTGQGSAVGSKIPSEAAKAYYPGDVPRQGGNPAEVMGTAVFKEDKLAGVLDNKETRALAIVQGKLTRSFFVVEDPLLPKLKVNVAGRNGRKPKINVDLSGENPVISVDILLEGEVTAIPSGIQYERGAYLDLLEAQLSNVVTEEILQMLQRIQSWGTDVPDFGYYIRPQFRTMQEMEAYNWEKRFRQAEFNVTVRSKIRRTGLMKNTSPIRREQQE